MNAAQGRTKFAASLKFLPALVAAVALSLPAPSTQAASRDDPAALMRESSEVQKHGDFAKSAELLRRALKLVEGTYGPDHPNTAVVLNNLAFVYLHQAHYAEAEPLLKRALAIKERTAGPDNPEVAPSLNNLAAVYDNQGRFADAEPLYRRALAIWERARGPNHPDVAAALNNLAALYQEQGRYSEAEPLHKRVLAIREKAFSPGDASIGEASNNLGALYRLLGRAAEAETLFKRALAIYEKTLGPDHPYVGNSLNNLALLYVSQNRYADAEPLDKRALAIYLKTLGPDYPGVVTSLNNVATLYDLEGRFDEALSTSRQAVGILTKYAGGPYSGTQTVQQRRRVCFLNLVHLLAHMPSPQGAAPEIVDEAFRAAQYAGGFETAHALAGMTARAAAGSDALAALVRERQDLLNRWRALDSALVGALAQPPGRRNAAQEAALRKEQAAIDAKLQGDDARLRADFPRFADLAEARPVGVADVQSMLAPQEAFIAWTLAEKESYLFVIRKDRAIFRKIDMTRAQADESVQTLRAALLGTSTFDVVKAHELYAKLLMPADDLIADAKSLIIVPDGALQSLPPSLLVTEPPAKKIEKPLDYRSVAWLIRRQALIVMPAASSLVSLRRFAEAKHAQSAFIGFGDPDFRGDGRQRGINAAALFRGADPDVAKLRALPRLPETADELRAEAKALGAAETSLHLGAEASVTNVLRLDLADVRVIAFATHGLIAGDLPRLAEPALALTPPVQPSPDDDGLLRASQVSQLKLNADFVVLSACNTAAPDGKPGAEGLSGLAKAFFYAGARSLLVSHWPVDSEATVKLTTGLIRATAADPAIGRAEALRRSILAMIDQAPDNSDELNPASWAPFILAGEGGAGL